MHRELVTTYGVLPSAIVTLRGQTPQAILQRIRAHFSGARTALLYYTGHGCIDNEGITMQGSGAVSSSDFNLLVRNRTVLGTEGSDRHAWLVCEARDTFSFLHEHKLKSCLNPLALTTDIAVWADTCYAGALIAHTSDNSYAV